MPWAYANKSKENSANFPCEWREQRKSSFPEFFSWWRMELTRLMRWSKDLLISCCFKQFSYLFLNFFSFNFFSLHKNRKFHSFVSISFCSCSLWQAWNFFFLVFSVRIFPFSTDVKLPRHVVCLVLWKLNRVLVKSETKFCLFLAENAQKARKNGIEDKIIFEFSKLEMATNSWDRTICREN